MGCGSTCRPAVSTDHGFEGWQLQPLQPSFGLSGFAPPLPGPWLLPPPSLSTTRRQFSKRLESQCLRPASLATMVPCSLTARLGLARPSLSSVRGAGFGHVFFENCLGLECALGGVACPWTLWWGPLSSARPSPCDHPVQESRLCSAGSLTPVGGMFGLGGGGYRSPIYGCEPVTCDHGVQMWEIGH